MLGLTRGSCNHTARVMSTAVNQVPEEVANNLFLLPGSPVMEDIDRRMTISEGRLDDTFQRNWQGAPLHVSCAVTTNTALRVCAM